jgi:hypothetical protein
MIKLSFHLCLSNDFGETRNVVFLEINCPALVLAGLPYRTWRPGAFFTEIDGSTHSSVEIMSGVLLA